MAKNRACFNLMIAFFQSQDGAFYRAVLCVHHGEIEQAQRLIDLTREMLDTEVTALSLESYQRAYPTMVCIQVWPLLNFLMFPFFCKKSLICLEGK